MLAGVGPVPAVLFVVAADDGWMPQSQEHLDALTALGVRHGVLVITRSDLLDPEPAAEEARAALAGTSLAHIPTVAVSAVTGSGMDELRSGLERLGNELPPADVDADVRLWVDRSFTIGGAGTVVTGTLGAGTVRTGDTLRVGANGPRVVVRGLQSLGRDHAEVPAPARVAVNLRGVANSDIARGDALLTPDRWYETATVDVQLTAPGTLREHVVVHCGSAAIGARVRPLTDAFARLSLEQPLPLRIGDRMILRTRTPGSSRRVRWYSIPHRPNFAAAAMPVGAPRSWPRRPPTSARSCADAVSRGPAICGRGVTGVPDTAGPGDWLLDPDTARSAAERLGKLVDEHARTHPLAPGLPARRRVERSRCPTRSCWPRCSNMRTPSRWTTAGSCDATPRPASGARRAGGRPIAAAVGGRALRRSQRGRARRTGARAPRTRGLCPGGTGHSARRGRLARGRGGGRRRRGAPGATGTLHAQRSPDSSGNLAPGDHAAARGPRPRGADRRTGEDGHVVA